MMQDLFDDFYEEENTEKKKNTGKKECGICGSKISRDGNCWNCHDKKLSRWIAETLAVVASGFCPICGGLLSLTNKTLREYCCEQCSFHTFSPRGKK